MYKLFKSNNYYQSAFGYEYIIMGEATDWGVDCIHFGENEIRFMREQYDECMNEIIHGPYDLIFVSDSVDKCVEKAKEDKEKQELNEEQEIDADPIFMIKTGEETELQTELFQLMVKFKDKMNPPQFGQEAISYIAYMLYMTAPTRMLAEDVINTSVHTGKNLALTFKKSLKDAKV